MSEPIELSRWRGTGGLVRIDPDALARKLALRGKSWSALRVAVSSETLAKIQRGEPVKAFVLRRITVALVAWPELEHAADLLDD